MFFIKFALFGLSGAFIAYGLVLQTRRILNKALYKKTSIVPLGIVCKLIGFFFLGYLILTYKMQDFFFNFTIFLISALAVFSFFLFSSRDSH